MTNSLNPSTRSASLRAILAAGLCAALALISPACSDSGSDPQGGGTPPSSLSFVLNGSTTMSFEGEASWPASGTGVIARMDSAKTTLQIAAYRQTSGKAGTGPEPRFTMVLLQIDEPSGITAGIHLPSVALFGEDLAIHEVDSLAYFGISGSFYLSTVSANRVRGTFSGIAMRETDSTVVSIGNGNFDAAVGTGLLSFSDTGSVGGSIAITADTGTAPVYVWTGGPVFALGIARAASPNSLVWGIMTAGGDSIATGVTHGVVPAGATLLANGEPALTRGVTYRITVSRVGGAYGYREFVP